MAALIENGLTLSWLELLSPSFPLLNVVETSTEICRYSKLNPCAAGGYFGQKKMMRKKKLENDSNPGK